MVGNYTTNIYLLKVAIETLEKKCEICSKLTIKTPEILRNLVLIIPNHEKTTTHE